MTDEGPRSDTSLEALGRLAPAFKAGGSVTAGNSSPMNDGAAAVLLASAEAVDRLGLHPMARIVAGAAAGVHPDVMGVGTVPASEKALTRAGISVDQLDLVEVNEAFASQAVATVQDAFARLEPRQRQRGCNCPWPSVGCLRGPDRHNARPRALQARRPLRTRHDVRRSRSGNSLGGGEGVSKPPLDGIRVIEFGNLVAAPYCGMLLADLGAEIIKVEPFTGDLAREIGPFYGSDSAFFIGVNRGKQSLALDSKDDAMRSRLWQLCANADVVVHNLRKGAMERMGLGHDALSGFAPHLVYAAITAFGGRGPYADRSGIDLIFQGEAGMISITGDVDDPPRKTATTIADFLAGTNAALAICAALKGGGGRNGGEGRLIEISFRDGLIAAQAGWNAQYFATGSQPPRTGTASPVTGPNQALRSADGYFNLAVVSDRHFRQVCSVLGLEEVATDPRFATNPDRVANREELTRVLESALIHEGTDHWLEAFGATGVPVGRILDLPEVFSDPQVIFNEMLTVIDHPTVGAVRIQGSPIQIDAQPARAQTAPPLLGQHTRSLLMNLGMSTEEVDRALAEGKALEAVIP